MKKQLKKDLVDAQELKHKNETEFKDEYEYIMDLYKKVVNQKDLFEEKFMQAVKAKEEHAIRQEDETKKLKAQFEEQLNQVRIQHEIEVKKRDQLITQQDLKIQQLNAQTKNDETGIRTKDAKLSEL